MSDLRIREMLSESGLAVEEMGDVLDLLVPLDELADHAPQPSEELSALLGRPRGAPVPLSTRRKRAVAGALVLALSGVGATGLSAAANTLPRPLQHRVSEFSRDYLPFDLPEPPLSHRRAHGLAPLAPLTPADRDHPTASRSSAGRAGDPDSVPTPAAPAQHRSASAPRPSASPEASSTAAAEPRPTSSAAPGAGDTHARPPGSKTGHSPGPAGSPSDQEDGTDSGQGSGHDKGEHRGQHGGPDGGQDGDSGTGQDKGPDKGPDKGQDQSGGAEPGSSPEGTAPAAPGLPLPVVPQPLPDPVPDPASGIGGPGNIAQTPGE